MSLNKVSTIVYLWVWWWCGWGYGPPGFSRQKTILYFPWTMSTGQSFPSGKLSGMNPSLWTRQQYTTEYLIAILWFYLLLFLINCQQEQHTSPFASNIWLSAFLLSCFQAFCWGYSTFVKVNDQLQRDSQESELVPYCLLCQMWIMFTHVGGRVSTWGTMSMWASYHLSFPNWYF